MVRLRRPFPRLDASLRAADDVKSDADQPKRTGDGSSGNSPSRKRLKRSEDENATASNSSLCPIDDAVSHASSSMWNDKHRRLYEHLQARRAGNLADTSPSITVDTSEKEAQTIDAADSGSPKENIYETLLGRIHKSLEQLHIQHEETANQSSAVIDPPATISSTSPLPGPSTESKHSQLSDPSAVSPPPTNLTKSSSKKKKSRPKNKKSRSKNKKSIIARKYVVTGTKADRLRSYLKYWPKRPSPSPSSSTSSPRSSSPSSLSTRATPETSPEAEAQAEDDLNDD